MVNPQQIRQNLEQGRSQLTQRLAHLWDDRSRSDAPLSPDVSDQATEMENDDMIGRIERAARRDLEQFDHALARLATGQYGNCEDCGDEIETNRLHAVPQATFCLSCAELRFRRARRMTA